MAEAKTLPTGASVSDFIDGIEPEGRREEARTIVGLCERVTGARPVIWGTGIIGFGEYRTRNTRGEVRWMPVGYHPAKANHSLHLTGACHDSGAMARQERLMEKLGPHRSGVSCLYIRRLADIDMAVLEEIVRLNWESRMRG